MDALAQYRWNINFISEIEKRPGIWNSSLMSRPQQKQLWEELSELNNKPVDLLKRKYSNLKLGFRHQLSIIPKTDNNYDVDPVSFESDWPYYRQMLFLVNETETTKNHKRKTVRTEENTVAKRKREEEDTAITVAEKGCGNDAVTNSSVHLNEFRTGTSTEIVVKPDIFPNLPADDGLYHFLMSLHDCMSELDPIRKITVQARIYAILRQEVSDAAKKRITTNASLQNND